MLTDTAIERIARGLIARDLPKPEWTHAAHFAAALWLLRAGRGAEMPTLIRAYNEACGVANTDTGGYHETITRASLGAAAAALAGSPQRGLEGVLADLLGGACGDKDWLLRYWTRSALFSVRARRAWVAPDRAPLPFAA